MIDAIADEGRWRNHRHMCDAPALTQPHIRRELQTYLSELRAIDPLSLWNAERERGLASGIDAVFHFFFDDHDFDEAAVGISLHDLDEVRLVNALMQTLNVVIDDVGDADDATFVSHPLWHHVREAAAAAASRMATMPNGN